MPDMTIADQIRAEFDRFGHKLDALIADLDALHARLDAGHLAFMAELRAGMDRMQARLVSADGVLAMAVCFYRASPCHRRRT